MPLQATSGAASYDGFGGGVAVVPNYIEDVFSTYLYTGDGSSAQNINNGIDLAGKGGMVWVKSRSNATTNVLVDTNRFVSSSNIQNLFSDSTAAASASANEFGSFNSNGFSIPYNTTAGWTNFGTRTFCSWTWRKQPKFFDVVTYTGTGSARTVAHSLGAVPGCIIVKRTDSTANWEVFHRAIQSTPASSADYAIQLNLTNAAAISSVWDSGTPPTATVFTVGSGATVNASGGTYVAYLFAHDAGGFGLTGTDNVISCGSATPNGSGVVDVTLGYEPQWLLVKTAGEGGWFMLDTMRGFNVTTGVYLRANTSDAESSGPYFAPNATGFTLNSLFGSGANPVIYIAIRRGPMKVPTLGTSVFSPITSSASTGTVLTTSFPVDLQIVANRTATDNKYFMDRLRGVSTPGAAISTPILYSNLTDAEVTNGTATRSFDNTSFQMPGLFNGYSTIFYNFQRAPSVFDIVCYTGTGVARTVTHNLTVAPELMIIKVRTPTGYAWRVYAAPLGVTQSLRLNTDNASETDTYWNGTAPTSTVFSVNNYGQVNNSGSPIVAYLFATCPGVSKVFSYTGNGSSQTINCGFTAGSRFVMIKRTDDTGDWYVWDSARGIVAGNDPHLSLNTTAAEVTTDDSVDTDNTGFIVNQVAATNVNVSSATYIGLAIA